MQRKTWDVSEFNKVNLPDIVGKINPSYAEFKGIRVLDMPIYMPKQGWEIPENLYQFMDAIKRVYHYESKYSTIYDDYFVYITVDQKKVLTGKTGRRAGAHSDAYVEVNNEQFDIKPETMGEIGDRPIEVSHTYIMYDSLPTEFFAVPFPLKDCSDKGSLVTFDRIAEKSIAITYPINTLLKLDPYVVHRCAVNTGPDLYRTFIKISVSKQKYAREGNTINPKFKYDWVLKARSPHLRNTPW
jgi:hypothetical protein